MMMSKKLRFFHSGSSNDNNLLPVKYFPGACKYANVIRYTSHTEGTYGYVALCRL